MEIAPPPKPAPLGGRAPHGPLISVVIPARNAASQIGKLLRSLLPDRALIQEILLVDDGSTDATAAMAQEIARRHALPLRVLSVCFGKAGAARNAGLAQSQGRFVYFVDADDELVPAGLTTLAGLLADHPSANLAIGACIRQTAQRPDKTKTPHGYGEDCGTNVVRYLANELWPIAMGSALLERSQAAAVRFPETIDLDEDTVFWTAILAKVRVVTTAAPVLIYRHDEARMARRLIGSPRQTLLKVSRSFRALAPRGIPRTALKKRIAWVALRMARQLIRHRRYAAAAGILKLVRQHPEFASSWPVFRYICRIQIGSRLQQLGFLRPRRPAHHHEPTASRRILIVTVDDASSPVSGADHRNHQNAMAAAKLGRVQVVSIRPGNPGPHPAVEFRSVGVAGDTSLALVSRRCSVEARISRASLLRLLELSRQFGPDTIIVEGVPLSALLKHLRPLAKTLILDMHNIESALAASQPPPPKPRRRLVAVFKNDLARIRRLEQKAIRQVDRIWVCAETDRERLLTLAQPDKPIWVVPNGTPQSGPVRVSPRCAGQRGPVLLMVGHLGYWPNVIAAERLVRGILPKVQSAFHSTRVILAGRHPKPSVLALAAAPHIELHANPETVCPYYEQADIAVVPLSQGGGTRIKILEAMAVGLPVVATPIAAAGLSLADHEEIQLAESDDEFAGRIIALWQDPQRRARQIDCARTTATLRFGGAAVDFAVKQALALAAD